MVDRIDVICISFSSFGKRRSSWILQRAFGFFEITRVYSMSSSTYFGSRGFFPSISKTSQQHFWDSPVISISHNARMKCDHNILQFLDGDPPLKSIHANYLIVFGFILFSATHSVKVWLTSNKWNENGIQ